MVDTAPIRPGEELPLASLAAWLAIPADSLTVRQFPGGHSNLTYLLATGATESVLRRAPLGPIPPKAHDMVREYGILTALHPHFPPAPKPLVVCTDPSIIGSPFYLMERRNGLILREPYTHLDPAAISQAFVDCLVQLHRVPLTGALAQIGKPAGFLARQVAGWTTRWHLAATPNAPDASRLLHYLETQRPPEAAPAVVHNDFKLDNLMFRGTVVEAVLDWEMTTIGDPLVDLGLALTYWDVPAAAGWLTPAQLAAEWGRQTGRSVEHLPYHLMLGRFKLAVILQQIYARWRQGQTQDPRFAHFDERVAALIEEAQSQL